MIQTAYDNQQGNALLKPTPLFWNNVPLLEMIHNPAIGWWDELPVRNFPSGASSVSGWEVYVDTSCTLLTRSKRGGEIRATFDGTAEDSVAVQGGGGDGGAYSIETASGAISKVKFETCIAVDDISTAGALTSFILGLGGAAYSLDNGLVDSTGELGTAPGADDFIGFHLIEASNPVINFTYRKDGQTKVIAETTVHTLVADAYVKLGFFYNPFGDPARAIEIWVNGVPSDSLVIPATVLDDATFPLARPMAPVYHGKLTGSGGTANAHDIPFMRVAQWY